MEDPSSPGGMGFLSAAGFLLSGHEGWLPVLLPFAIVAYVAPFLIAFERRHRYLWTIAAFNLITGWTVFGWVAALVWSINKDVKEPITMLPAAEPASPREPRWDELPAPEWHLAATHYKRCVYCAEQIRTEAIVCRYCGHEVQSTEAEVQPSTDLPESEKRRLQALLEDGRPEARDPTLLDVFEYARLLEIDDSGAVIAKAPVAGVVTPLSPPVPIRPREPQTEREAEVVALNDETEAPLDSPVARKAG
jgi:hypothetical protein